MYEQIIRMLKMNDVEYRTNEDISRFSSIKIGGSARMIVLPDSTEKLLSVLRCFKAEGLPYKVVGRMTNILPPDEDIEIPIITTRRIHGFEVSDDGCVISSAGDSISSVLHRLSQINIGGCEALSGIPGTLGGLVTMNAGAFGREISDFFREAWAFDSESGDIARLSSDDMRFSYRNSAIRGSSLVLLTVKLALTVKTRSEILLDIQKYRRMRLDKQPTEPSLGSVFLRCGDIIPAKLIDDAGLRGIKSGGAQVSEKHAGFIVNSGGATAGDFKLLVERIKREVYRYSGVILREEVEYL